MRTPIFHSLYFKLTAGLALILLIVGLSYSLLTVYMAQQINLSSTQLVNRDLALKLVKQNKIVRNGDIDREVMKKTFMNYMMINPSIEIYYLDLQGNVLAFSAEPGKVKRRTVDVQPIVRQLGNSQEQSILGDDPRSAQLKKVFSVTPIPSEKNPQGYLYVMLQSEQLTQALSNQARRASFYLGSTAISGSLVIGMLIGLYLFYRIHNRLNRLQKSVSAFVDSDFTASISPIISLPDIQGKDEISVLEKHIGNMADHIQKQWFALKQQDKLRRELVANISHDLRTPLTSIQCFLETLSVKYNNIDDLVKQDYIASALKQTSGLRRLIDSLFELTTLDTMEQKLDLESFPLMELVYDVTGKFELNARQKQIQLKVESETDNPIVFADLSLIERVLDNLISNAIHYSHRHSFITIKIAAPENSSLTVNVIDTGQGIPENQAELVFERFYQAHTPERKDGHAGLGLCIVKKIIELHHQRVWVESKVNQGAQFNFTLATS